MKKTTRGRWRAPENGEQNARQAGDGERSGKMSERLAKGVLSLSKLKWEVSADGRRRRKAEAMDLAEVVCLARADLLGA